ncbi:MAG: guanylate kinase [Dehalococcoidia bacterium]
MSWGVSNRRSESRLRTKQRRNESSRPLLVVLSGPSGVGKDAVVSRMKASGRPFYCVVTATTRPKRAGEKDGVDYHFLSQKEFQQMIAKHRFLEWAVVYGNYYGVPKDEITSPLSKGLNTIVKVDVQGAATIKKILPQAVFIFLMPPSLEALRKRLRRRRSESSRDLATRLETVEEEIERLPLFDYVIISRQNKLDEVVSQIDAIISAEKCRVKPRIVRL